MPPCFDVYIWLSPDDRAATLAQFINRYVKEADPGEPRFEAFMRTFVHGAPTPEDAELLAELRHDPEGSTALTVYLRCADFHEAIVALTDEGDLVLGLGLDDPLNDPTTTSHAEDVLRSLMDEFNASAGIGGVELPPPHSHAEWSEDHLVIIRINRP